MTKAIQDATKIGPFRVAPRVRDGVATGRWMVDLPPHVSPTGKRSGLYWQHGVNGGLIEAFHKGE